MNEGINLLAPNKNTGSSQLLRRIQKMRFMTIALLFIISVSSVILFILVALSPLPTLQRQEQFLRQSLNAQKDSIVKLSVVDTQTTSVAQLISKRKAFDKQLALIQDKVTKDMTVIQMQVDSNSLVITVESPSLKSLDTFINNMTTYVQKKNMFSKVILVDLTTDEASNEYAVSLQLDYL